MPQIYGLWLVLEVRELEMKCEVTNRFMLRYTDDVIIDQIKILGYIPRGEGGSFSCSLYLITVIFIT